MDPQGNLTSGLGVDKDSVEKSIYELIIGEVDIKEVINKEVLENLDIIPTSIDLSASRTFFPFSARQAARLIDVVVLPTPPF